MTSTPGVESRTGRRRVVIAAVVTLALAVAVVGFLLSKRPSGGGAGGSPDERNAVYMRTVLGKVILDYRQRHGSLPQTLEEAVKADGARLPRQGDLFGNPLIYVRTGPDSFYFLSYGANGKFELGNGDDLIVSYADGRWFAGEPPMPPVESTR